MQLHRTRPLKHLTCPGPGNHQQSIQIRITHHHHHLSVEVHHLEDPEAVDLVIPECREVDLEATQCGLLDPVAEDHLLDPVAEDHLLGPVAEDQVAVNKDLRSAGSHHQHGHQHHCSKTVNRPQAQ